MYVGIDIGGTNLVAAVIGKAGQIISKSSRPVNRAWSAEELCDEIAHLGQQAATCGGIKLEEIQAVGIGLPGLVDNESGMVIQTPNMPFRNTPLRELFQKQWNVPVYLGNDANCAAIGEYWAGAAKGCGSVVMITLGTGIGGGLIVNGKLHTGFANSAMEVGHMIIHPLGNLCGCGNRGCWEQYGSATALIRTAKTEMDRNKDSLLWELCEGDSQNVEGRTPFQAARMGDETAKQVLSTYLSGLSVGIINLVNILQPEIICLGGGISNAEDELLLTPLCYLVSQGIFDKKAGVRIEKASLGNDAGVIGAAMLCNMV